MHPYQPYILITERQKMNYTEAIEKMTEVLEGAKAGFDTLGVSTKIEYDYMDRVMNSIRGPEKAKYITATLVLSTPEIKEGEEYCLSLGAEINSGKVSEDTLGGDVERFLALVKETEERIASSNSAEVAIRELANEASLEFQELVGKIKDEEKKSRLTSIIGIACVIAIFVIITAVSLFTGSGV